MMSAEKPPRRIEPGFDTDEDSEAGARLGVPPPDWGEEGHSVAGLSDGRGGGTRAWMIRGAIAVIFGLGVVPLVWFAYQLVADDRTPAEIPLVTADPGPVKVKPDDPGGKVVPYQDQLVLNEEKENGAPRVEKLLPPPEVPMPVPVAVEAKSVDKLPLVEAPDLADGKSLDPVEVPSVGQPEAAVPEDRPAEAAAAESEDPIADLVQGVVDSADEADPVRAAEPAESSEIQVAEVVGTFVLQIASLKSREAAQGEWTRLQKAFPDLLSGLSLVVQEAAVETVGKVYRMQIGTFPTRSTAADLCAELKARNQDCFVLQR